MRRNIFACMAVALCTAVSISVSAGVCRIGSTEYDTLQSALVAMTNMPERTYTITLVQDIDVTGRITIPYHRYHPFTIDGDGHMIRQACDGWMFHDAGSFSKITFKNVTLLGGGENCSVNTNGVFFHPSSLASTLTFDSGCVISNFVFTGSLIGADGNLPEWSYVINPGAVIACNRGGTIFKMAEFETGTLTINGGEIYGNIGYIARMSSMSSKTRTKSIFIMNGGRIHHNTNVTSDTSCLFDCNYKANAEVHGGEIFDNDANIFVFRNDYQKSILTMDGGMIFGNRRKGVFVNQWTFGSCVLLSGNAVLASEYSADNPGVFLSWEHQKHDRLALNGDFTGYATACGSYNPSYRGVGCVYGTNLNSYAGAENIHIANAPAKILQTANTTGELVIRNPSSAKIGEMEYPTFADALAAAVDGDEIGLLRDCILRNTSIVPPSGKAITVNGGGYRIFRSGKEPLVDASASGGNMTFTNVELNEGFYTCLNSYTNHVDGVIVRTLSGVSATVTLGPGTVLSGGRGTNALVRVANGATVNLDGCVITGAVNRAIAASVGGTLGVKGATVVKGNAGGDIDVADGNILSMNGNLTGSVHVTVAGVEACEGQKFGTKTGDWIGEENFVNGGSNQKLHVSTGGILAWCRRGLIVTFR